MSMATFFIRECPTCGRCLQIRVEYLGRLVRCKHCDRHFHALDPSVSGHYQDSGAAALERANELLASLDAQREQAG
jgi:DNA-directed RNA polymerase subunit M/transcription elongation factor TFIIS